MGSTTIGATVAGVTGSLSLGTAANGWTQVAPMLVALTGQTATLLQNGEVMVLGADEIYDPTSNTWSALSPSLPIPLDGHTATLLPNGKVLIAGGVSNEGPNSPVTASAELYDPVSNSWSSGGSMSTPRESATATLLPNGQVLVAGGGSGSTGLASAEVYDPVANTWSLVASMTTARESHTATLLQNGLVLVVGGTYGVDEGTDASAELYDSVGGTWSSAGTLTDPRAFHTATLLPNGNVIVIGGSRYSATSACCIAASETYDPTANTWSVAPSLSSVARENHIAVLLPDGTVLVAGGYDHNGPSNPILTTGIYDPVLNTWSDTGSISSGGSAAATLLSNGAVLVVGGDTFIDTCTGPSLTCPGNWWVVTQTASAQVYWP
jgi:N-acetylneuraminic acid mutarotase